MELSYRTRRNLRRAGLIALVVLLVSTVVWACWLVWVERHIFYTRDGAVLDFSLTEEDFGEGQLAQPPAGKETASIYYNDGSDTVDTSTVLTQAIGYYVDYNMLASDIDTVRAAVASLPVGSAVMLELKSIKGNFYYSTEIENAKTDTGLDAAAVDQLIADIASRNLYLIASLPALRDRHFGLEQTNCGLPYIGGGGALWLDDAHCYWLDPTKSGTLNYLTKIAEELEDLGFDEVMFTDFRFPDTDQLDFSGNKTSAIQDAAAKLVEGCATDKFAVSFLASNSTVKPVSGRSRLYLTGVEADKTAAAAERYKPEDPAIQLVFLTDSYDTRYDAYSVLRPMSSFAGLG